MTGSSHNIDSAHGIALPEGVELGKYLIIRKIGQGGFGITYLAQHIESKEHVVVKENMPMFCAYRSEKTLAIHPLDDGEAKENYTHTLTRFVDEARTLARLHHPNIVRVLEAFEALGTAYYVMPLITGKELHKAAPATVDEAWLAPILRTLLGALDYLHGKKLLHRDLKPGNILLQEDGTPIIIDFGTARALQSNRSATMVGTPGYTPIEQITVHGNRGPWTDLYALGATCYRIISGELPPEANERLAADEDPYRPLAKRVELRRHFSVDFLQSIDTALAIRAKNRWQSAREWLEVLPAVDQTTQQPVTQSLPVSSIPTSSPATDEKKDVPSRKRLPIILAILLLALSGGAYGVYSCTQSATEKRMREELAQAEMMNQLAHEKAEREAKEEAERLAREKAEREAKEKAKKDAQDKLKSMGITDYDEAILKYYENPDKLQLLITAGADVNKADKWGVTSLYQAADNGRTEIVKLLLAAPGIDVNKANKAGETPLYRAARFGHTECVKLLLAAPGIEVNKAGEYGETPLFEAVSSRHTECVKLLLAAPGIDVNKADKDGRTPLYRAAQDSHTKIVKLLLAAPGIEVNKANKKGYTPLYRAARYGHTECVKLLLSAPGIDISNWNALSIAVLKNDCNTIKQLLQSGADVNKADMKGETPLFWAAVGRHTECVKLLLAAPGIEVNKAGEYGETPLYWAAVGRHTEIVKLLLAAPGIDVNKANKDGYTPLSLAARFGDTECVKLLLAAPGIDVNKADEDGETPLYWAAVGRYTECVKLLLAAPGIEVNKADGDGRTPLYRAARFGDTECVKLLLAAPGIDVNKANRDGETPLYWAEVNNHTECVELLRAAGAKE
ncbi:MAG: ankyrin repeat domain-containing protein [Akkermansia sp.]|nr:ankyrin repeat domain-containing protein [Akkermansia sp.]